MVDRWLGRRLGTQSPFGCLSDKCPNKMRIEINIYAAGVREAVRGR